VCVAEFIVPVQKLGKLNCQGLPSDCSEGSQHFKNHASKQHHDEHFCFEPLNAESKPVFPPMHPNLTCRRSFKGRAHGGPDDSDHVTAAGKRRASLKPCRSSNECLGVEFVLLGLSFLLGLGFCALALFVAVARELVVGGGCRRGVRLDRHPRNWRTIGVVGIHAKTLAVRKALDSSSRQCLPSHSSPSIRSDSSCLPRTSDTIDRPRPPTRPSPQSSPGEINNAPASKRTHFSPIFSTQGTTEA
jgi:hypothetical protein